MQAANSPSANSTVVPASSSADKSVLLHLRHELDLRNCALDAATTHFLLLDARLPGWPIVYTNRALAQDFGYEPAELLGQSAGRMLIDREKSSAALTDASATTTARLRGASGHGCCAVSAGQTRPATPTRSTTAKTAARTTTATMSRCRPLTATRRDRSRGTGSSRSASGRGLRRSGGRGCPRPRH